MHLAQGAQHGFALHQAGAAARMVVALPAGHDVKGNAPVTQQLLHRAPQGVEVLLLAVDAQAQGLGLGRQALSGGVQRIEHRGGLVEAGGFVAVVHVQGQGFQHARHQGGAHNGGVLAQGIANLQGLEALVPGGQVQLFNVLGAEEGEIHDLVVPHALELIGQVVLQAHAVAAAAGGGFTPEQGGGNLVVAVDAQHFLGEVGFAFHILAEIRHHGGEGVALPLHIEVQRGEDALDIFRGNIHAGALGNALAGAGDYLLLGRVGVQVNDAADHVPGVQLVDELAGAVHGLHGGLDGNALLKPAGGLRADAQGAAGDAGGCPVEHRALEHHGVGLFGDFALLAAHDARHAGGLAGVADHQLAGGEGMGLAVQGGDVLALHGPAHDDVMAFHHVQVKGVHGMTGFQHDEVSNVHHVVNGAHARPVQVLAQPHGGGPHPHVLDDPGHVAGAQVGVADLHLHIVVDVPAALLHGDFRLVEGGAAGHGGLPGHAPHAQAVRAVGQHLEIHHRVVDAQDGPHVRAQGIILLENQQARRAHGGVQLHGHAQLLGGAEHALAGHAAQLALLDLHAAGEPGAHLGHGHQDARLAVGRAADDLQGLALANVHGGYAQMVAVGMGDAGEHPAHHHVLHLGAQVFIALHAVAAHNHAVHVRLGLQGNGGIGPDPLHGNLQCQTPPCGSYGCILG